MFVSIFFSGSGIHNLIHSRQVFYYWVASQYHRLSSLSPAANLWGVRKKMVNNEERIQHGLNIYYTLNICLTNLELRRQGWVCDDVRTAMLQWNVWAPRKRYGKMENWQKAVQSTPRKRNKLSGLGSWGVYVSKWPVALLRLNPFSCFLPGSNEGRTRTSPHFLLRSVTFLGSHWKARVSMGQSRPGYRTHRCFPEHIQYMPCRRTALDDVESHWSDGQCLCDCDESSQVGFVVHECVWCEPCMGTGRPEFIWVGLNCGSETAWVLWFHLHLPLLLWIFHLGFMEKWTIGRGWR